MNIEGPGFFIFVVMLALTAGFLGSAITARYYKAIVDTDVSFLPVEAPSPCGEEPIEDYAAHCAVSIEAVIAIESGGNPRAESPVGARGLMQIMEPTWREMVRKMKKDWPWEDVEDPIKNRAVGTYYMNVEVPRLLKHYGMPDTLEFRLVAYNWGIGNLRKAFFRGEYLSAAPAETRNYIEKYKRLVKEN